MYSIISTPLAHKTRIHLNQPALGPGWLLISTICCRHWPYHNTCTVEKLLPRLAAWRYPQKPELSHTSALPCTALLVRNDRVPHYTRGGGYIFRRPVPNIEIVPTQTGGRPAASSSGLSASEWIAFLLSFPLSLPCPLVG